MYIHAIYAVNEWVQRDWFIMRIDVFVQKNVKRTIYRKQKQKRLSSAYQALYF